MSDQIDHSDDSLYVFKFKNKGAGFVVIPAQDSEMATLRAWKYDSNLTFFSGIDGFIELLKGGKLWDTIQQQEAENTEKAK